MEPRQGKLNMADGGEATPQQSQQSSEEPLGLRAVLIGATGAIGECLLGELLCSKVCSMSSKSPPAFVCALSCCSDQSAFFEAI